MTNASDYGWATTIIVCFAAIILMILSKPVDQVEEIKEDEENKKASQD